MKTAIWVVFAVLVAVWTAAALGIDQLFGWISSGATGAVAGDAKTFIESAHASWVAEWMTNPWFAAFQGALQRSALSLQGALPSLGSLGNLMTFLVWALWAVGVVTILAAALAAHVFHRRIQR